MSNKKNGTPPNFSAKFLSLHLLQRAIFDSEDNVQRAASDVLRLCAANQKLGKDSQKHFKKLAFGLIDAMAHLESYLCSGTNLNSKTEGEFVRMLRKIGEQSLTKKNSDFRNFFAQGMLKGWPKSNPSSKGEQTTLN